MGQARGADTRIVLIEETTFNTTPGTPTGQVLYLTSATGGASQNRTPSRILSNNRGRTKPAAGNIAVAKTLTTELHAESMGTLLKHTLGSNATTGIGPYVHTITVDDLPVGFELDVDYGAEISGSGRFELFTGCRVNGATFTFPSEGYCTASFDIMGADSALGTAAQVASPTDNGRTPFSSFSASITEGGSPIAYVQSAELSIASGLDGGVYVLGGAGVRRDIPEADVAITGTINAIFESAALLAKAIAGTESSLVITLSHGDGLGSAGNESMAFNVQQLLLNRMSPGIDGPGGIMLPLTFEGYASGADIGLEITVKNPVATI